MKIPTTLKHKPVIVVENYGEVDGKRAYGSDAQGLSIGLAQWNDRGSVEASAKVWRHTGEKWSRQSEELPLHRVLDLESSCVGPISISRMPTDSPSIMILIILRSTGSGCRETR